MANLLPQHIKEDVRREYRRRLAIIAFSAVACVLVLAIVSLMPTYIILHAKKDALSEFKNSLAIGEEKNAMSIVGDMGERVHILQEDTYERNIPYSIFVTLFKTKTDAVTITRISFSQKDNELYVKGVAATRSSLKMFIDDIGKEEMFLPIDDFPYSGFSEPVDLPFDFTIKLSENYDG